MYVATGIAVKLPETTPYPRRRGIPSSRGTPCHTTLPVRYTNVIMLKTAAPPPSQTTLAQPTRLAGDVNLPGDKSISHRAAIFNAIATGSATVSNLSHGADVASTLRCLRALGVSIEPTAQEGAYVIHGLGSRGLVEPDDVLDAGNSGTTLRLMSGVLAHHPFFSVLTGDASLRSRPVYRVVAPLRLMGAVLSARDSGRLPPLAIRGASLKGVEHTLPVASAQVKTAITLAGIAADGPTTIRQPALSRDHTELMLRAMGARVGEDGLVLTVHPSDLKAIDVVAPGDISSAAFWLIAAVCHPNAHVRVLNVGVNPTRTGVLDILQAMDADVTVENRRTSGGEPVADLVARSSQLRATEIAGDLVVRAIDEIPILSVAACFAEGTTTVRDAQELRVKETDRIQAIVQEMSRLGASVEEREDGLAIHGGRPLRGASVESHGDHRMAMSLAVAGTLAAGQTTVLGAAAADVSYPTFWDTLASLEGQG